MKKINVTKEDIGRAIKGVCKVMFLASLLLPHKIRVTRHVTVYENADYSDAVGAIMDSDMFSSHKIEAVSYVPKNADSQVYSAIIQIVRSNMFSSHKVKAISDMCNE